MPKSHYLTAPHPLSQQVAQFLAGVTEENRLLVTPTAGAARRVSELIEKSGAKAPLTSQPMQALLPVRDDIATHVERCLAWAEALQRVSSSQRQTLFWSKTPKTTVELLKSGLNFNSLCDRLAEAGLDPTTLQFPIQHKASFDEDRWSAIAALYRNYIACLRNWNLCDPNALRLEQIEQPSIQIDRLVIAAVADLPRAFERYAQQIETSGTAVDVLIWNPTQADASSFDRWGRPIPGIWNSREIDLSEEQIHVAASAQDEARTAVAATVNSTSNLVVADPKLHGLLAGEILSGGRKPYLPEGERLIACEAAKLALDWEEFRQSKDLRHLRRLLELPAFCRALDTESPILQANALIAIDYLLGKTIATTLDAAWSASPAISENTESRQKQMRGKVRRLLGSVRSRLNLNALDLIEAAFPQIEIRPESAKRVIEIGRQLERSPALKNWRTDEASGNLPAQIFAQAIRNERLQSPASEDAIALNGWLEAPWFPEPQLVLCGLTEGRLPQSLDGDPFLPDSICPALGLSHNEQRLARDAYLLTALIAAHPADQLRLSYSKYNNDGDPNKPSRLLLRTALNHLPARVQHVTTPNASAHTRPRRQTNWRWQLPDEMRSVTKISATQFEAYLTCPFRFCLEKVFHYKAAAKASHEMDAAAFGNLIHQTLENFGREIIPTGKAMLRLDELTIRNRVQQLLTAQAHLQFGEHPAPAVQVQLASAAARLHAFARVQAECFSEGWIILDVERKLEADHENPLTIGPLKLTGIIDRIEQHTETGALRVMDYKTFSSVNKPAQTHFAPASHNWLSAAQIELESGKRTTNKTWKNLQLPLYRKIIEHWYPDECASHAPEAAYFVLPSDPNETGIYPFDELNETVNLDVYTAALDCAEAVAQQIADGVFWPPQPFRGSWEDPFAPLFVNGAPENCIAPATIAQLKGGAS